MNKTKLVVAALLIPLVACDTDADIDIIQDQEDPGVQTGSSSVNRGCTTIEPNDIVKAQIELEVQQKLDSLGGIAFAGGGTINVYYHVIRRSNGQTSVTSQMLNSQISVLNSAYAASGWSFNVVGTDYSNNDAWYTAGHGSTAEKQMKAALRKGG